MRSTFILAVSLPLSMGIAAGFPAPAIAQPAAAEPPGTGSAPKTSALSWTRLEGAEACIPMRELAQAVEQRLGRAVFVSAAEADLSVEGRVEPVREGESKWRAVIVVSDAAGAPLGTRELDTADAECRALDDQVALAIALMIDPDALLGPPPPPPPPSPPPPPDVVVRQERVYVPVPVLPPPAPPPDDPWIWEVRAGPMVGFGVLPDVALGLTAGLTITPPWFIATEGAVGLWLPQSEGVGGGNVEISAAHVQGALCPLAPRAGRFGFDACAESQLGFIRARGLSFAVDKDQLELIYNAGLRARGTVRLEGPLLAGMSVAGHVPLLRDRFVYRNALGAPVEVFRMSPVLFATEVHLGLRFE